jgi:hypothetical protein
MIAMVSKVKVDVPICSHETIVTARDKGDGNVEIDIESDCPSVAHFARLLHSANMDDLTEWNNNRIFDLASRSGLTTTCLVPTAIMNCAWVELGMISRSLALEKRSLCLHFVE